MGTGRRIGLVSSSDDEDKGRGDADAIRVDDDAGPSCSSAPRKRLKHSISQAASGPQITPGKRKEFKRLKRTADLRVTDSVTDSDDDEDYEDEDIMEAPTRQRNVGRNKDRGVRQKNRKASSVLSPSKKRRQRFASAQKTSDSKAGGFQFGFQFEDIVEESTEGQTDAVQPPLGKEFEQYLLEEVFSVSEDTYTKEMDIPERFQVCEQLVNAYISKGDWSKEAHWIYDRAFESPELTLKEEYLRAITGIDKDVIVQEIMFVLLQLHIQKCEIPFIGMYNFHGCMHLAQRNGNTDTSFSFEENKQQLNSFKALWWIFHWDRKWLLLQHRIDNQLETWKKRAALVTEYGTLDNLIQALQNADSELVVDDLEAKFNLKFPTNEIEPPKGQYKRPKRQSYYDTCCRSGLGQLVKKLGLTAEQLGENLQSMQKIHESLDCDVPPGDVDLSSATGQFTDVNHALAGARHMAAYKMSCEPSVRNYVRRIFSEHAVLSTRPTGKGISSLDNFHEFASVKSLQENSLKNLDDGEWLIIKRAEEEGFIEVVLGLTQETLDGVVMQGLQENYCSSGSNEAAVLWNEQRKLTLQESVSKMILPFLIKETRMSLTAKAKALVQAECSKNLWKKVSVAPFPAASDNFVSSKAANDATAYARVLACCWGSRNPPTTFVMLDSFGELIDTLQTGYLTLYSGNLEQQLQRKTNDQERLQRFMIKHQPHVVVVGATVHYACRQLKDTIAETVSRAAEMNTNLTSVPIVYGDESMSSLYEKSPVSSTQLPKQPGIVKRAVALGRSLQNPLALIASLCNPNKDFVALNLHPMQRFLSTEELYNVIEQVLITVTNQVGFDVHLAVAHEWLFWPLQFICGLGWKKACMLHQLLQRERWLRSRGNLLRYPFSLKDVVFRNCCAFLRIRRIAHAVQGLKTLDPLDDTRIHPESYELARNLATYAFSKEQALLDGEGDEDMAETAVVHIRQNPDTLTEEIVMEFFNSLHEVDHVKIETLKDIRAELLCGFSDLRAAYTQPTQDDEFVWLTGEDDASLSSGRPVNVTVHKVFRHRLMCILECGLRGVLEKEDFTSDTTADLTTTVSEGTRLTCFIRDVLKDQFLVNLTCKEDNLQNKDASYVQETSSSEKTNEKLGFKDYVFKPRDVCHPLFENVSVTEAIKKLLDKNSGEVVFHPSSRGPACLSMTLKCRNDVYLRKEIEEPDKDSTNLAAFLKLGGVLKVGGRSYQNLDEVVASYASPLLGKMEEVLQLIEFRSGKDSEIKSFLYQEKGVSSTNLVYCFSMFPDNPGAITVSYVVDGSIKQETIDPYPEGFGYQNKMFRKIDTLINYLKKATLALSYDAQTWEGRGEGTARGRGRGGRFGSGRRGRGRDGRGEKESGTFSGGWGDKGDWSQSQNDNGYNNSGRGERGSFRGRRGRGRGHVRAEEGDQWGQADNKSGDDFWSGGTGSKDKSDTLTVLDVGNAGNDGWGTANDEWGSVGCHTDAQINETRRDDGWGTGNGEWESKGCQEDEPDKKNQREAVVGNESFRGRRRGGRGFGRAGEGTEWGQENNKSGEDFWSGGTVSKDDADSLKVPDAGHAGNDGWGDVNAEWGWSGGTASKNDADPLKVSDAGNAGNDGWGKVNDDGGWSGGTASKDSLKVSNAGNAGNNGWGNVNDELGQIGGTARKDDADPLKVSDAGHAVNDGWGNVNDEWGSMGGGTYVRKEGGTFSGGWGEKADWSQSRNDNGHNNRGRGERGSFRGRRGRGIGYGRAGEGGQWREANKKSGPDFWSGGTGNKDDTGPLKKVGNDGWGTGNNEWGSKDVQKDRGTFSRGWGDKEDRSQSWNDNAGQNHWRRGERGSFRGRRGRGRGFGRAGMGGQWGQANDKGGEDFWSGPTGGKDNTDPLKVLDAAGIAGNDGWGTVNDGWGIMGDVQNKKDTRDDGWGTGNDDWGSKDCHVDEPGKKNGKDAVLGDESWGAGNVGKDDLGTQNDGWGTGNDDWGSTRDCLDKHKNKNARDSGVERQSWGAGSVGNDDGGTRSDGWGSRDGQMDENKKSAESFGADNKIEDGTGATNNCWGTGNVGNESRGTGNDGWASETPSTVSKSVENGKKSQNGCDAVEREGENASASGGWKEKDDGWGN